MILLRVTNKFIDLPFIALSDLKITPKIVISAGGNELLNKCNKLFKNSEIISLYDLDIYSINNICKKEIPSNIDLFERSLRIDRQINNEKYKSTIYHQTNLIKKTKTNFSKKNYINNYFYYWLKILKEHKIRICIISTIVSVDTLTLIYAANLLNIKFIFLQHSRIKDRYILQDKLMLKKSDFNLTNIAKKEDIKFSNDYYNLLCKSKHFYSTGVNKEINHLDFFFQKNKNINLFNDIIYKSIKRSDDYKNLRKPNVYQFYKYKKNLKINAKLIDKVIKNFKNLNEISFKDTIYLPLPVNPENSISFFSKYYDTSEEIINEVIKIVPKKFNLIIKENPSMIPYRKFEFYDWLFKIPNVTLINPFSSNIELLKNSSLTLSVNGTSSLEAAILGSKGLVCSSTIFTQCSKENWILNPKKILSDQGVKLDINQSKKIIAVLHANSFSLKEDLLWGDSRSWYDNYNCVEDYTINLRNKILDVT